MAALCYWGMRLEVSGGAVLLGNATFPWWCGVIWGISLQVVNRNVMVASRWRWVVDGGAVSLGNAIRGFHGGAVLLGNVIEVVLGCGWWRCARGKCTQRVANRIVMVVSRWVWEIGESACTKLQIAL